MTPGAPTGPHRREGRAVGGEQPGEGPAGAHGAPTGLVDPMGTPERTAALAWGRSWWGV